MPQSHVVDKSHYVLSMSASARPAVRVDPPSYVQLETADCFGDQIRGPADVDRGMDWEHINPATGPVYVAGAEPGDVLAIRVESIDIAEQGVMCTGGGFGVLGDTIEQTKWRFLPIRDGLALWDDQSSIPIAPMIGVIGVAPAREAVPCETPGPHGGNMDTRLIAEGAVVYLPVQVTGALLAVGDLHAAMGDGEVGVTGIEVSGSVVLHVGLRRDLALTDPLLENATSVATIASARTLDEAAEAATRHMASLLHGRLGMPLHDAVMLMSAAGNLEVSQVVDPLKTARFVMPKLAYERSCGRLV